MQTFPDEFEIRTGVDFSNETVVLVYIVPLDRAVAAFLHLTLNPGLAYRTGGVVINLYFRLDGHARTAIQAGMPSPRPEPEYRTLYSSPHNPEKAVDGFCVTVKFCSKLPNTFNSFLLMHSLFKEMK